MIMTSIRNNILVTIIIEVFERWVGGQPGIGEDQNNHT